MKGAFIEMLNRVMNSSNFPFLKDVINLFLKTVIIMIPCVIGSLIRSTLFHFNSKSNKKMYILYSIVPSFALAGILSKFVPMDVILGLSAVIGLISRDLTEGASNISGLIKTYNMIIKIIKAVKDVDEVQIDEQDIPKSLISMAHEIEKEDNKKRESEEMIKYESSDGELEIKDKNVNS